MPAVNIWQGTSDNFSNAAYWTDGIPTVDDILLFSGLVPVTPIETLPGEDGPPSSPPPPPYSNVSVTFPTTGHSNYLSTYAGIRILNGYGGTVTFPANLGFAEYTQNSGATSQAGNTITVTSTFGWTGGAINTSSNAATMKLLGVTGQIGEDHTSLSTGSRFVLEKSGSAGTYLGQAGTLNLLNDVVLQVLLDCELDQRRINTGGGGPKILGDGTIFLDQGRQSTDGGEVPAVKIEGGSLFVKQGGMKVTNKVQGTGYGVTMEGGVISIKNGSTLEATHGVYMNGGDLLAPTAMGPTPQVATIDGELKVDDGRIILGTGDSPSYSTLKVTQRVTLVEGLFQPKVDATNGTNEDNIQTDEKFDLYASFEISPQELNGQAPKDTRWTVLESTAANGFVDDTDPTIVAALQAKFSLTRGGTTNKLYLDRK